LTQNGGHLFCVKIRKVEKHNQTYQNKNTVWSTKFAARAGRNLTENNINTSKSGLNVCHAFQQVIDMSIP